MDGDGRSNGSAGPADGGAPRGSSLFGVQLAVGFLLLAWLGGWVGRRLGHPRGGVLAGVLAGFGYLAFETWKAIRLSGNDMPNRRPPPPPPGDAPDV